jgi:2-isopropylmalate synthase
MPRRLQIEFSAIVQQHADTQGGEVSPAEIRELFARHYMAPAAPPAYVAHHLFEHGKAQGIRLSVQVGDETHLLVGEGNGPIDAAVHALRGLGHDLQVRSYEERSMGASGDGGEAQAIAVIEVAHHGDSRECFGVAIDGNIVTASIRALVNAAARLGKVTVRALASA